MLNIAQYLNLAKLSNTIGDVKQSSISRDSGSGDRLAQDSVFAFQTMRYDNSWLSERPRFHAYRFEKADIQIFKLHSSHETHEIAW